MAKSEISSRSVLESSNNIKTACEPCEEDGKQTEAGCFCVDCSKYLCGSCVKDHQSLKDFQNHVILNKAKTCERCEKVGQQVKAKGVCADCSEYMCGWCYGHHCCFEGFLKQERQNKDQKPGIENRRNSDEKKTVRLVSEIDVCTRNDKEELLIEGLAVVHGHVDKYIRFYNVVVSDYSNTSMKVVDTRNNQVTDNIDVKRKVWGLTNIGEGQVAVAAEGGMIMFLLVSNSGSLSVDHEIHVSGRHNCGDIVHNKGRMYVTQADAVLKLSMTGRVMSSFSTDSKGNELFQWAWGIAIDPDNETLYVSDQGKHTVTSLTLDGKLKVIYKNNDLNKPGAITVDNDGSVYVCSCGTGTVHQLSKDLVKVQILDIPTACISFSSTDNRLYTSDCGKVRMYELK